MIKVVAALIEKNGKYLIARRSTGSSDVLGKWEFPGGKIEPGETPEQAIKREIKEELNTDIAVKRFFCNVQYDYPSFHLDMDVFLCEVEQGSLQTEAGIHLAKRFKRIEELNQEDWCPADALVVKKIVEEGL